MNILKHHFSIVLSALMAATSVSVNADEVSERLAAALADPARDEADRERDGQRKPLDVISFIGIETGMSVLDVSASAGWYTEVLAAAVGPNGRVIAHNVERFAQRSAPSLLLKQERYPNIEILTAETADGFGVDGQIDAAWTALNFHDYANRSREGGLMLLQAIYAALKSGGVLAVIDHEGVEGADNASLHRIDIATVTALLEEAGFVVEAESQLLDNPADDQSLHMRDESLERNTDRFVLRARKPG